MTSIPVDPVVMKDAMKVAITGIDIASGPITNDEVLTAICTAVAASVNVHTHGVGYVGAGLGSSTQTTTATPPGNP